MDRVVKEAADACAAQAGSFGSQIENLANGTTLPEEARIEPGPKAQQGLFEVGKHAQAEASVRGNLLMAG